MEYLNKGELIKYIINHQLEEEKTKYLFYEALLAISHLHSRGICHRDIKPENFLLYGSENELYLKLVDFGLSKKFLESNKRIKLFRVCGSPTYIAPEVLTANYDERCDIWSAGVMLFVMLTKNLPYNNQEEDKMKFFKMIVQNELNIVKIMKKKNVSNLAIDLVSKMLIKNPNLRISM